MLALGAFPIYLIARDRSPRRGWVCVFAVVYLMYAPIQWISWANFHPEALVITPLLFAWWFASHASGGGLVLRHGADRPVDPRRHRAGGDHARSSSWRSCIDAARATIATG